MYFLDPFVLLRSKLKLHDSEPRCRVGVGRGEIGGSNILTPGLQCFCTKIHIFLCTITLAHKSLPLLPCPKPQELPVTGLCLLHLQIPHHFPDRIQTTESVSIDKCGRARRGQGGLLTHLVSYQSSDLGLSPSQTPEIFFFISGLEFRLGLKVIYSNHIIAKEIRGQSNT